MKKKVLVPGLVALLVLGFLAAVAGTAQAGCGTEKVDCRIEGGKKVGDSNFSFCWNWRKGCEPCHGYAHLAKWCNENFNKCEGRCWGAVGGATLRRIWTFAMTNTATDTIQSDSSRKFHLPQDHYDRKGGRIL